MKVKNLAKKFLCIASAVAMAAALMAEPIQVQAAGEVYTSELTGLPVSASLKDQRPIAVMVDNEKVALKHFGTAEADIVYEMMNSTANDRITRLMCIYKDYNSVPTIGSIRSIRPTNIILAGEYNAICVHDGGPYYINEWLAKPWSDNLSAGFETSEFGNSQGMQYMMFIQIVDVFPGNDIDFSIPIMIERVQLMELFCLFFRKFRKVF